MIEFETDLSQEEIEVELMWRTQGIAFGLEREIPVDVVAWAALARRLGWDACWALDWIRNGYPEPPLWMYRSFPEVRA